MSILFYTLCRTKYIKNTVEQVCVCTKYKIISLVEAERDLGTYSIRVYNK